MWRRGWGNPVSNPVTNTQPALLAGTGAAKRAADALLRAAGGRAIILRLPVPAQPADPGEQLGLATPQFQDIALGPAVFRKARPTGAGGEAPRWELLLSGSAVERVVVPQGYGSAAALFAGAAGVMVDTAWFEVLEATESQAFGQAYVHRLLLRARAADLL